MGSCHRDAQAIPIMYERLSAVFQKLDVDYEMIFVNDGSPDETGIVLAELASRDRDVVVIDRRRNFGSQSAFTSGMNVATGDGVILLDGDLQDPPELIEQTVRAVGERLRRGLRRSRPARRTILAPGGVQAVLSPLPRDVVRKNPAGRR